MHGRDARGAIVQNPFGGGGQIVDYDGGRELAAGGTLQLRAITGAHEDAFCDAGIPAGLKIYQLVPDDVAAREVDPEFIARVEKKLRRWLAAPTRLAGRFGRDVNFLKAHAVAGKNIGDVPVDALDVGQREITATDAGLIGDDEQFESRDLKAFQCGRRAGKYGDVLNFVEVVFFRDQGAVAIQENSAIHEP